MWNFFKSITGRKEKKEDAMDLTKEIESIQQNKGSMSRLMQQARRNPRFLEEVKALLNRMQKDGVDVKNSGQVKVWIEKHKEELTSQARQEVPKVITVVNEGPKVGRNDPCHCGSGKKYKKCCMVQ